MVLAAGLGWSRGFPCPAQRGPGSPELLFVLWVPGQLSPSQGAEAAVCPQGCCRTSGWRWTSTAWAWEITIEWLAKAPALVPKFPKSLPWIAVLTSIRSAGDTGDTAGRLPSACPGVSRVLLSLVQVLGGWGLPGSSGHTSVLFTSLTHCTKHFL